MFHLMQKVKVSCNNIRRSCWHGPARVGLHLLCVIRFLLFLQARALQLFLISFMFSVQWFLLDPFYRRGRVYNRKFCVSVCLSVDLSVITFSFSDYWIIGWLTSCKPNIFWKHITLATSTALFWSSISKYRPVPPYTDPVPPRNNQCRPLPTKYNQVPISTA